MSAGEPAEQSLPETAPWQNDAVLARMLKEMLHLPPPNDLDSSVSYVAPTTPESRSQIPRSPAEKRWLGPTYPVADEHLNDLASSAVDDAPATPELRGQVPAPMTPPKRRSPSSRLTAIVCPFAFKELPDATRFNLEFDNVESFKLWLATGTGTRRSFRLSGRRSYSPDPGWGVIDQLQIAEPNLYVNTCIGSVRWVHWGDGSVRVDTMTDTNPTTSGSADRTFEKYACDQAEIRRSHLLARIEIVLALRNLSKSYSLPTDSCGLVLSFLFPQALCLAIRE